jgi:hypothetical protein
VRAEHEPERPLAQYADAHVSRCCACRQRCR